MIRVTVHRKLADGSPSLSVPPRRGFKTFENAANAAMRLLADETRQPGHERVAECAARNIRIAGGSERMRIATHIFTQPTELNAFFDAIARGVRG